MNRPQDKEQDKRQGQQSGMPQTNRPDEDMANQQSKRPSAGERASDQDERFGPGSSRDNDKSENAPSREDSSRSRGGQSDDSR